MNFDQLSPYTPRTFVDESADLTRRDEVTAYYQELLNRPVTSQAEFEQWVRDESELAAALDQQGSILYIRMTCETGNAVYVEQYKDFLQNIVPSVKPLENAISRRFLDLNAQYPLEAGRYRVLERNLRADIELFSQENVPLQTDVQMLSQEYQSIFGEMTVLFQGQERTLPEMAKFQEEPERNLREQAWRLSAERRIEKAGHLEHVFDTMLGLRNAIARNAGFANFMDYQFQDYHRFDYRPEHCRRYHETVRHCVVPLWEKILQRRRKMMGLDSLRPWDLTVDPQGREPLRPFRRTDDLISGVHRIFQRIDPLLGVQFHEMIQLGLLDLDSRKGKAPGGYQNTLAEARKPFIFMNAVGMDADVRTLLHEGGHAFHALASADEPLYAYRHAPMEFCEVASMSMELLGNEYLEEFYTPEDARRSSETHLEQIIHILAWVATIDAFQHWIYEHPDHTREERTQQWDKIYQDFDGAEINWSGLEHYRRTLWHRQLHIFEVPFYYIEYGIAQLGALQIWKNYRDNPPLALEQYKSALAFGGSRSLPELFAAAGIEFDFSDKTIRPLVEAVAMELDL